MAVAIPIIVILVIAIATTFVLALNRSRGGTGSLSRETRRRDKSDEPADAALSTSTDLETTGRERADETRATYEGVPARRRRGDVTQWEPVDEEELGVSRRQFLNRGLGTLVGFSLAGFGAACLGFLWPTGASGFGGKISAGATADINAYIDTNAAPFY